MSSHEIGATAVALLRDAGVQISDGLGEREFDEITDRFGFRFGDDHRAMLAAGLPVGRAWVDWRGPESELRARLEWPTEGVLAYVEPPDGFWLPEWGSQPDDGAAARRIARRHVLGWPTLVPVYSHRYTPARPSPSGASVLSVHGTDIIYYGADLLAYLSAEFELGYVDETDPDPQPRPIPPWTNLYDYQEVIEIPDPWDSGLERG